MVLRKGALAGSLCFVGWVNVVTAGCFSLSPDGDVFPEDFDAGVPGAIQGSEASIDQDAEAGSSVDAETDDMLVDAATGEIHTVSVDAIGDGEAGLLQGGDGGTDGGDGGTEGGVCQSDFYVDHQVPDAGSFPTIVAALAAANVSCASTRTIHLASGVYSASTGESFPITLRHGISLVGAGAQSLLMGVGSAPVPVPATTKASGIQTTIVVGDPTMTTTIADLAIQAPALGADEGIVCDRGTTTLPGTTTPNTLVDNVTIDGFDVAMQVSYDPAPPSSGCAARVTSSRMADGAYGIVAEGLADSDGSPIQRVSIQLGDGTASGGNQLDNFIVDAAGQDGYLSATGLLILDAVTGVKVSNNSFSNCQIGLFGLIGRKADPSGGFDFEGNDFGSNQSAGIELIGPFSIDRLVGNNFHDTRTPPDGPATWLGGGLILGMGDTSIPSIVYARNNIFFGNDSGLIVRSSATAPSFVTDFGTPDDPGNNVFRCNYSPTARGGDNGGDVYVSLDDAPVDSTLFLAGDIWDHAPPNGNDLRFGIAPVPVNVSDASAGSSPVCPSEAVP